MKNQIKVLLYVKRTVQKPKTSIPQNSLGLCPLMGKITIKGQCNSVAQFFTKLKVQSELWNATSQRCMGKSKVAVKTNREIEAMLLLLHSRFDELCKASDIVKATDVKSAFQGSVQSQILLLQIFKEYNEEYKQRVGVNRTRNSLYKYQNTYNLTQGFVKMKYKVSDVTLKSLDMLFIEQFDSYLKSNLKQQPNTRRGHITRLKSVIKTKGVNPFKGYRCEQPIQRQRYLSQEELNKLMTTELPNSTRGLVRDMFLFSVFTGICYCDIQNLTKEHIKRDNDGNLWIETKRQKTGTLEKVLLLDIAQGIMAKYSGDEILFPMMTYRNMLKQLKNIAKQFGITRNMTFHQARHTFATVVCLNNGVPIETISKMLGHTSIKTTQVYAEITNQKLAKDLQTLAKTANQKYKLQNTEQL